MENIVYLAVYFPQHTGALVVYRFTVALGMHALASFILGFGINRRLVAPVWGEVPLLSGNKRFFITAIVLHGVYNIAAVVGEASGLLKL